VFSFTEQFPVEVITDFYIEAPDAFTPNDDGNNDVFMLETKNIKEIKEFRIFNRWETLFSKQPGWMKDGTEP